MSGRVHVPFAARSRIVGEEGEYYSRLLIHFHLEFEVILLELSNNL